MPDVEGEDHQLAHARRQAAGFDILSEEYTIGQDLASGSSAPAGRLLITRATTPADLGAFRALWSEYAREVGAHRRAPWPWTWEDVAARLENAGVFLARAAEEEIGFAIASRSRADLGHIDDLYVRAEHRRRGVATALVREIAQALRERGVEHVALDVDVDNAAARKLYTELGFEPYAERLSVPVSSLEERLGSAGESP